jgi:hypothetical protein
MSEISTAQITVSTTPVLLAQADTDGCLVILHTHANHGIAVGKSDVTAGTGFGLHSDQTVEFRLAPNDALYGIRTGSQDESVYVIRMGNR